MQLNNNISVLDKVISILSYYTMGIAGLIWLIISFLRKKKNGFFLTYNIAQSMVIAIFLAFIGLIIDIILRILTAIPFLSSIGIKISMLLGSRMPIFGLTFNIIEIIVFLLLLYIIFGVLFGRIFRVPLFTDIMRIVMRSYK